MSQRKLTEITFGTDHYLANLLAMTKILGLPLSKVRSLCKAKPEETKVLSTPLEINSKLTTDDIIAELDEYEIKVHITN